MCVCKLCAMDWYVRIFSICYSAKYACNKHHNWLPYPQYLVFKKYILVRYSCLYGSFLYPPLRRIFLWRPTFNIFSERQNNQYLWTGIAWWNKTLFKDTLGAYIDEQKPLFKNYQTIVTVYRGDATFLAYLGSKNVSPCYQSCVNWWRGQNYSWSKN